MRPESKVVPSLSCVIERFSNLSCQKGSRCPFTRMTYLIHLCSVWMTFRLLGRRIPSEQVEHSRQKDTKRLLSRGERSSQKRVAKRLPCMTACIGAIPAMLCRLESRCEERAQS